MDLSKSFESVCHNKLLNYLNDEMRFKNKALTLFKSYLENRTHKVRIVKVVSKSKCMTLLVSQVTALCPLLNVIHFRRWSK